MLFSVVAYFFVENKDPPANASEIASLEEKNDAPVINGEHFKSRHDEEIVPGMCLSHDLPILNAPCGCHPVTLSSSHSGLNP